MKLFTKCVKKIDGINNNLKNYILHNTKVKMQQIFTHAFYQLFKYFIMYHAVKSLL